MVGNEQGFLEEMAQALPILDIRLERIKASMVDDPTSMILLNYIIEGWPSYDRCAAEAKNFYTFRDYLTSVDGLVFYKNRLYIPPGEQSRVVNDTHRGHQGEVKCIRRASEVVWWPGMTKNIRDVVKTCEICAADRKVAPEPLMSTEMPERPWWRVACDLFEHKAQQYIVVVDYYSRYIDARKLDNATSETVMSYLLDIFSILGIPHTLVSDNGPQFVSEEFSNFLRKWDIVHVTSAPRRPQSNGAAERAVQTVKTFLNKNLSLRLALLHYRDTPIHNGFSPAQLLLNRSLNSIGIASQRTVNPRHLQETEVGYRLQQQNWFNRKHRAKVREPMPIHSGVQVHDPGAKPFTATVLAGKGRELLVQKENGTILRRNRCMVTPATAQNCGVDSRGSDPTTDLGAFAPTLGMGVSAPITDMGASAPTSATGVSAPAANSGGSVPASGSGVSAPARDGGGFAPLSDFGQPAPNSQEGVSAPRDLGVPAPLDPGTSTSRRQSSNVHTAIRTRSGRLVKPRDRLNL
jgi:hypothetical protein